MGDPSGQLKSLANSRILLSGPQTRNCDGEWTPVVIRFFIVSAGKDQLDFTVCVFDLLVSELCGCLPLRNTEHQVWAADIQNICCAE